MPKVIVTLVEANFEKEKKGSEPDAFCTISVTEKVGYKSKIVKHSNTPTWNESFHSDVEVVPNEIIIECWNRGRLTDDFLGKVVILPPSLNELVDKWFDFTPREGKKEKEKIIGGQIRVQLLVQPDFGTEQQYKQVEKRFVEVVDPKLYEELDSIERQRQEVLYELVTTETGYVADLNTIIQVFLEPLRSRQILTKEEIGKVFSNIEAIVPNNTNFLKELQRRHSDFIIKEVGDLLLETADLLKLYAIYCSNQPIVPGLVDEYRRREEFASFLNETPVLAALRGLTFESFLIKPLQRVCKYPLLLKELSRYTPENHADFTALNEAILKIKGIVDQINERTRQVESVLKLKSIAKNLVFGKGEKWKDFNLVQMNRMLVREGKARVSSQNKAKYDAVLFLFNDILLITAPTKKGTYEVKQEVQVMTASITDLHDSELFDIEIHEKEYTIQMTSKDEKKVWLSDISKLARKSRSETEGRHKAANNSTPRTGPPGSSSSVQQLVASQTPPGTPTPSGPLSPMSRAPSTTPTTPSPLVLSVSSSGSESSPRDSPIAHSIPIESVAVSWSDQPSPNRIKDALDRERGARQLAEAACVNMKEQIRVLERANVSLEEEVHLLKLAITSAEQRYGIAIPLNPPSAAEIAEERTRKAAEEAAEQTRRDKEREEQELEEKRIQEEKDKLRRAIEEQERKEREAREKAEAERIQNERLKEIEKILAANDWDETKLMDEWETAIEQMWGGGDEVEPGTEKSQEETQSEQLQPQEKDLESDSETQVEEESQESEKEEQQERKEEEEKEKEKDQGLEPKQGTESNAEELQREHEERERELRELEREKEKERRQRELKERQRELELEAEMEEQERLTQEQEQEQERQPTETHPPSDFEEGESQKEEPKPSKFESETAKSSEKDITVVEEPPAQTEAESTVESKRELIETESSPTTTMTTTTTAAVETDNKPNPTQPETETETKNVEVESASSNNNNPSTPQPTIITEDQPQQHQQPTQPSPQSQQQRLSKPNIPSSPSPLRPPSAPTHPQHPPQSPSTKGHAGSQKETTSLDVKELERKQVLLAALNRLEGKLKDVTVKSGGNVPSRVKAAAASASSSSVSTERPKTSPTPAPKRGSYLLRENNNHNTSNTSSPSSPSISPSPSPSPSPLPSSSQDESITIVTASSSCSSSTTSTPRSALSPSSSSSSLTSEDNPTFNLLRNVGKSTNTPGSSLEKLLLSMIKDQT